MQQTFRKIKRVQPIINLKKARVDEEAAVLNRIRSEKIDIVKAMKENQRRYMDGVEELNRIRTSKTRTNLDTLEEAIDYVKEQWWKLYKKVQDVEQREREQMTQLIVAERELKSVEKLREKYEMEFHKELKKTEQKSLDELALRKFNTSA